MEIQTYAILDEASRELVNLVRWDGNTETWHPPSGTIAIPVSQLNSPIENPAQDPSGDAA